MKKVQSIHKFYIPKSGSALAIVMCILRSRVVRVCEIYLTSFYALAMPGSVIAKNVNNLTDFNPSFSKYGHVAHTQLFGHMNHQTRGVGSVHLVDDCKEL